MAGLKRVARFVQAGFLLLALPAAAQLKFFGTTSTLSGLLSPGYSADFGNQTSSDHNWILGGVATLSGSYYNPNFLSYNASVFVNQSRANSNYQSISNASGVNASVNLFSGSDFPGSVSYSKAYNSEGNYAIPGIANYVTHGNSDTFGINWSENIPGKPSFSAGFQFGGTNYSVYGTNDQGNDSFHTLNLHSGYSVGGFNMGAFYSNGGGSALIPEIVTGVANTKSHNGEDAFGFNLSHRIPLSGSVVASINRSSYSSEFDNSSTNGSIDTINSSVSMYPAKKLSLSLNLNYSDNLSGELAESIVQAGGVASGVSTNQSSNSLDLLAEATYAVAPGMQTSIFAERRTQYYLGDEYAVDSYGASATYTHKLFDGSFNAFLSVTDNSSNTSGEDNLGLSATTSYNTQIQAWHVTGSFSYAQNVQTLLVAYTNSYFNYSANVRRQWSKVNFSAGASAGRTALTQEAGAADSSQSYNASLGYGSLFTASGSYSKSSGEAFATGAGLVTVPITTPVSSSDLVSLYGGNGYSFSLASSPVRRLTISASYARSVSNTSSDSITSNNTNDEYNLLIQYQLRKLSCISGYSRLGQGFSGSGSPSAILSSYYVGVSRWFNIF